MGLGQHLAILRLHRTYLVHWREKSLSSSLWFCSRTSTTWTGCDRRTLVCKIRSVLCLHACCQCIGFSRRNGMEACPFWKQSKTHGNRNFVEFLEGKHEQSVEWITVSKVRSTTSLSRTSACRVCFLSKEWSLSERDEQISYGPGRIGHEWSILFSDDEIRNHDERAWKQLKHMEDAEGGWNTVVRQQLKRIWMHWQLRRKRNQKYQRR